MKYTLLAVSLIGAAVAQNAESTDAELAKWAQWENSSPSLPDSTPGVPNTTIAVADCDPTGNGDESFLITGTYNQDNTGVTQVCWETSEGQDCYNELGKLDNLGFSKDEDGTLTYADVVNVCRVREEGTGEKVYDFIIQYMEDYEHKDNCVEQEINFIERDVSDYVPGTDDPREDDRPRINVPPATTPYQDFPNNPHDQWYTNGDQLQFSVDHDDLEDTWGCTYTEHDTYYQWVCDIELNIIFSGEIQYTYEFQMTSTLDRTLTATLDVAVNRNVVNGDCCVNELQVSSSLFFCSNYDCVDELGNDYFETAADWGPNGKEVERRDIFYVAHRIDTSEFQHYWLQPVSLHIGPFIPKIHRWQQVGDFDITDTQVASTNILVYEVESYVALDNLEIKSVALLNDQDWEDSNPDFDVDGTFPDVPSAQRRLEQVGEDYQIKAESKMTVLEKGEQQQEKKQNNSLVLSFGAAALALFALL